MDAPAHKKRYKEIPTNLFVQAPCFKSDIATFSLVWICAYSPPNYYSNRPGVPPQYRYRSPEISLRRHAHTGNVDYLPLAAIPPGYGNISGTVLNGTGIPGVVVTTNTSNSTTSDTSGFYYLFVPAGAYNLTATKEPVFYSNSSVIVRAISGTTIMQDIELIKKPTGTINGTVTSV